MKISFEYRRVAVNAMYLVLVQGANYLVPLFMMFFLIDIHGVSGFGLYAFWYAVMLYVQTFVDYGFSFSGTREIASAEAVGDKLKVLDVFTTITCAKLLLALFTYVIILAANFILNQNYLLIFFVVTSGVVSALIPNWYFQGAQKIKKISLLNVLGKFVFCFLVYYFVDKNSTLDRVFAFYCVGSLIPLLYGYWASRNLIRLDMVRFDRKSLRMKLAAQYSLGWHIFTTTALSMVLSNGGVFWLGLTSNPSVLGSYAAAEKIVKALLGIFLPVFQAVYPLNSSKFSKSFHDGIRSAVFSGLPIIVVCFLVSFVFYIFHPWLIDFFNIKFDGSYYLSYLLCWMVLAVANNVLGIQILSASGYSARYAYSFNVAAIVFIIMIFFGVSVDAGLIVSQALVYAEMILTFLLGLNVLYLFYLKSHYKNR